MTQVAELLNKTFTLLKDGGIWGQGAFFCFSQIGPKSQELLKGRELIRGTSGIQAETLGIERKEKLVDSHWQEVGRWVGCPSHALLVQSLLIGWRQ